MKFTAVCQINDKPNYAPGSTSAETLKELANSIRQEGGFTCKYENKDIFVPFEQIQYIEKNDEPSV